MAFKKQPVINPEEPPNHASTNSVGTAGTITGINVPEYLLICGELPVEFILPLL